MAVADGSSGHYVLDATRPVRGGGELLDWLLSRARQGGPVLAGFDFPIGMPAAYGLKTQFRDFKEALDAFGQPGPWVRWFDVAEQASDISVHRPFYPARPGGTKQSDLTAALSVEAVGDLRRICERATSDRRAACPLFWTLGGNQVGKAAIAGWREIVVPAVREDQVAIWPFDGPLRDLFHKRSLVIAETYPVEAYHHVGVRFTSSTSKARRTDRADAGKAIREWASAHDHVLQPELVAMLDDGFGELPEGEDTFDAVAGLCGMLEVATGHRPEATPSTPEVLRWEGWILGQASNESSASRSPGNAAKSRGRRSELSSDAVAM